MAHSIQRTAIGRTARSAADARFIGARAALILTAQSPDFLEHLDVGRILQPARLLGSDEILERRRGDRDAFYVKCGCSRIRGNSEAGTTGLETGLA